MHPSCAVCSSPNLGTYDAEANIHFPGLKGIDRASVFVFPRFLICLDCGHMESAIPKRELHLLRVGHENLSGDMSSNTAA
jgi:hypothetical protein